MSIQFSRTIPILRIFSVEKAKEFYVDYLGFSVDWEHHFEENTPAYLQVCRGGLMLHLLLCRQRWLLSLGARSVEVSPSTLLTLRPGHGWHRRCHEGDGHSVPGEWSRRASRPGEWSAGPNGARWERARALSRQNVSGIVQVFGIVVLDLFLVLVTGGNEVSIVRA